MSEQQLGGEQPANPNLDNPTMANTPPGAAKPQAYADPTPSMYLGTPSTPLHMPDDVPEAARWQAPPPEPKLQSNTTLMLLLGAGVVLVIVALVLIFV